MSWLSRQPAALARLFGGVSKASEGEYRPGPYMLDGGWLSAKAGAWNWWQNGHSLQPYGQGSAMVEACVSAYSQTIAMCPGDHWRTLGNGGRERVTTANSALARILRKPNDYQTISDLMLNLSRSLYCEGNAYALALRNDRNEVSELHLMNPRQCSATVAVTGEIFYALGGNEIVDRRFDNSRLIVPARDVLHVRLHTPRHPLKGETPLMAAAMDIAAGNTMLARQIAFFENRAQPSFILSTDEKLTAEQAQALRAAWDAQTRGENAGGTPILSWGIKPQIIGNSAQDAQLAETMKMTEQHIALAFRVPLQILGIGGTPYASTELLMQSWIASGLGFALNHIEEAFGQMFRLKGLPDEYVEFDTEALLRSALKDRIDALARGVQGGIYSPDEARARESLPRVPGGVGAQPRVQQQVVPLDWHQEQARLASEAAAAAAAASVPQIPAPEPEAEPEPEEDTDDAERHNPDAILQRLLDHAGRLH